MFLEQNILKKLFLSKKISTGFVKKILNEKEISMSDASLFVYTTDVDDIRGLYFKTLRISFLQKIGKIRRNFEPY